MRLLVSGTLALLLGVAPGSYAGADAGIGITPGIIQIHDELKPGGRYVLPPVAVINTGDEKQEYEVVISYLDEDGVRHPPQKWLQLEPARFQLQPGNTQTVDVRVSLPSGAEPGNYSTLVEAQMVNSNGPSLQAGVATRVVFTVGESGWFETVRRQINNLIDDTAPWSFLIPGAALLALSMRVSQRWFSFRLPFEIR